MLLANIATNVGNSLQLMLTGMVGIFVVMGVLIGVIKLLNVTTADTENDDE